MLPVMLAKARAVDKKRKMKTDRQTGASTRDHADIDSSGPRKVTSSFFTC
jgi:hypothetical protein